MRLPWLAHDEAPVPYITIPQYRFKATQVKQAESSRDGQRNVHGCGRVARQGPVRPALQGEACSFLQGYSMPFVVEDHAMCRSKMQQLCASSTWKDTSYSSEGWTAAESCGLTNTELHTVGRHCQGGGHFVSWLWQRFSKQGA